MFKKEDIKVGKIILPGGEGVRDEERHVDP